VARAPGELGVGAPVTRTERFFQALGRFSVRARWLVILAWAAVAVIASLALPSMGSEVNNNNSQFLPASAPSERAANLASPLIGSVNSQSSVIIVAALSPSRAGAQLTSADAAAIARAAAAARAVRHVVGARVVGVSRDGAAAQIVVVSDVPQTDITHQKPVVDALEAQVKQFNASAEAKGLGLEMHVAGPVATNVANQAASQKTGNRVQSFSFLFIIVLLLIIFRSLLAPLITLAPAGVALVVSMRLIGGLGSNGLKISEITELLLIVLLLGAGTDYGLFLVFRTKEELRRGRSARDAVAHALTRVGESITASAGTVIFALLTLLLASFGLYHDLGVPLAIGVAVMLLAGLTLLPALLSVFGRAVFWPGGVGAGSRAALAGNGAGGSRAALAGNAALEDGQNGWWGRVAARLVAKPGRTLAAGVVLFVAVAFAALGYYSAGFGGALNAPAGSDVAAGNAVLAEHFPAASANPANLVLSYDRSVWRDAAPLAKAQASLESSGLFSQLVGPLEPNGTALTPAEIEALHAELGPPAGLVVPEPAGLVSRVPPATYAAYRSLVQLVSTDGRVVQWEAAIVAGPQGGTGAMRATPAVRRAVSAAAAASGASASGVAGEAAALYDVSSTSNHDITEIIPVAIAAIGVLLGLVLRSAVAPLYLIVSVGLSYLAALGVSTIAFIDLGGSDGITFILPFLMFIFLLALGEDYNILVMTRIREEARAYPLARAVVRAVGRTGPTVTSAGVVLAGTFGVLAFSASGPGSSQVRDVGFGLAIGILMDTFLVRTLLVPATVALLGRWNWWPSTLRTSPAGATAVEVGEVEPVAAP
jgi:RND superfamily putative drug exporter